MSHPRALSCDAASRTVQNDDENIDSLEVGNWSSDCSNSDDEDQNNYSVKSVRLKILIQYL